ncbi:MAG: lactate utilization protein [Candidatus Hermodarchaeota archaeon]
MWHDVKVWQEIRNWYWKKKVQRTLTALKKNGFDVMYFPTRTEVMARVLQLIPPNALVGVGGSVTIREIGLVDSLEQRGNTIISHWEAQKKRQKPEEVMKARKQLASADIFLTSTNAITEEGHLVNIDHAGQRVAAMIFGPQKVIIIAGVNKIVRNMDQAMDRIRNFAAPMNAKRLNLQVPCAKTGICSDCESPNRICNVTTIIERRPVHTDSTIILLGETVGF